MTTTNVIYTEEERHLLVKAANLLAKLTKCEKLPSYYVENADKATWLIDDLIDYCDEFNDYAGDY